MTGYHAAIRSIAIREGLAAGRGSRSRHRSAPDLSDDSYVPGKLAEHFNNRDFHSTEVFAPFAAHFFSRTLVPTLVMYLMKKEVEKYQHPERERSGGIFSRKARADKKWRLRAAAVDALAKRGDPALLNVVTPVLDDKSDIVRYEASATMLRLNAARATK
jgi:hypothetical protein